MTRKSKTLNIRGKKSLTKEENINLTYTFLKQGKSIQWIESFFNETQDLKAITVRTYLMDARRLIATEGDMDVDFASLLHDSRYESIWQQEKDAYTEWHFVIEEAYQAHQNREVIRRYVSLLRSMKQREDMYGLRDKDLVNALHSNLTLTKDHYVDGFEVFLQKHFDFDKLTLEEIAEMIKLMEKSYDGDLFKEQSYIVDEDEELKPIKQVKQLPMTSKEVVVESIPKKKVGRPKKNFEKPTESIKILGKPKEGITMEQVGQKLSNNILEFIKKKYGK